MVVETLRRKKLSYREVEEKFDVANSRILAWERIYLTEDPKGVYIMGVQAPDIPAIYQRPWRRICWQRTSG